MMVHHLPRSYLQALSVLGKSIKARRKKAQDRWKEIRRKSRLATILSRLRHPRLPNFTIEVVDKLERVRMAPYLFSLQILGSMHLTKSFQPLFFLLFIFLPH